MASHGVSQDPLNYLIRSTKASQRFPVHIKRHILSVIKKAKKDTPIDIEHRIAQHHAIYSHREMMHLEELIETLDATTVAYKNAIFALCKLTENYRRSLAGARVKSRTNSKQSTLKAPPVRGTE